MKHIPPKRKKIRGKGVITVDSQIIRWRQDNKKRALKAKEEAAIASVDTLYNAPGSSQLNDQEESSTPVANPWDIFN